MSASWKESLGFSTFNVWTSMQSGEVPGIGRMDRAYIGKGRDVGSRGKLDTPLWVERIQRFASLVNVAIHY